MGLTKETCVCIGEQKEFVPVNTLMNTDYSAISINTGVANKSPTVFSLDDTQVSIYIDNKRCFTSLSSDSNNGMTNSF